MRRLAAIATVVLVLGGALAGAAKTLTVAQDGSGNYRTVQAAINAASPGDTVYVKAGTYRERITFKSGITLQGAGRGSTVLTHPGGSPVIAVQNVTSGKITGFTVRYGGTGKNTAVLVDGSKLIVEGCIIIGASYSGIQVRYAGCDVLILNCILRGNAQAGAFFLDGAQGTVRQTEIYDNGYHGVAARGNGTAPVIEENVIRDNGYSGIYFDRGAQGTVRENEIYGNGSQGIRARDGGTDPLIENNVIRNNVENGVFFLERAQGTLRQNEIYGNGYRGVEIGSGADPIVADNSILDNKGYGIWVHDGGKGVIRNNTVIGNGSREIEIEPGCTVVLEGNITFVRVPPAVVSLDFPELVFVGYEVRGEVHFSDPNGDLARAEFEVLEGALPSFLLDLTQSSYAELVQGKMEGTFSFAIRADQSGWIRLRVTLVDETGLRSEPKELAFEARQPVRPDLTRLIFLSRIKTGKEQNGAIRFRDPNGDVTRVEVEIVQGDPITIQVKPGFGFDPRVRGKSRGTIRFSVVVTEVQTVKLRFMLVDSIGLRSEAVEVEFRAE